MPQKTFDIRMNIDKDQLAENICEKWITWMNARHEWEERYRNCLQYLYASTSDQIIGQRSYPWQSNVHIPKLTQLRDTLITYYLESLFSLKDYYRFEGFTKDSNTKLNRELICNLLKEILESGGFKQHVEKAVSDYIDAGNTFGMPIWDVETVEDSAGFKTIRWEGAKAIRINPLDIVFDPSAKDFKDTPKIIRTVLSLGELAEMADHDEVMSEAFKRAIKNREEVREAMTNGDSIVNDEMQIAGFSNLSAYYSSDTVELLTFYGSLYDITNNKLHRNTKITIIDRAIVLKEEPMENIGGYAYIRHVGWRDRKDILWGMSPLENVLGMQARIDFLENKRSDCYDYVVNPVKKIRGNVDMPDSLGPGDEVHLDADSDVSYLAPDTSILTADNLISMYEYKMEEFMGSPKEVLGFRTPGEKTMFEVNQLLTAATRIYQRQIRKFELEYFEPLINDLLQLYLNRMAGQKITLKFWDSDKEYYAFKDLSIDDIHSLGKVVVTGSSNFQDRAQIAQSLQMLGQNPLFLDEVVRNNFSPSVLGQIFSYVTGLDKFPDLIRKDQRLYEITDQQKLVVDLQQQVDEKKASSIQEAPTKTQQAIAADRIAMETEGGF